jgi:hypothetical protein
LVVLREDLDREPKYKKASRDNETLYRIHFYYCQCDCGNVISVVKSLLNDNKRQTKSCGCLQKESIKKLNHNRKFPTEEKPLNDMFGWYKRRAKDNQYEFEFTKDEFKSFIKQPCFYCGSEPEKLVRKDWEVRGDYLIANGVDRIDSTKGYTKDNTLPCCKFCNRAKLDLPQSQFLSLVEKIYNHRIKRIDSL